MIKGHLKNLDKVLSRLADTGLKLKAKKVQIFATISYLLGTLH